MNIPELEQKAKAGNTAAQSILGQCYLDGIETDVNHDRAYKWLNAAASKGASRAIANLGRLFALGLGVSQNTSEAIRLYEKAAEAGEFLAKVGLARIYSARGADRNDELAFKWYSAIVAQEESIQDCDELREAKAYIALRNA